MGVYALPGETSAFSHLLLPAISSAHENLKGRRFFRQYEEPVKAFQSLVPLAAQSVGPARRLVAGATAVCSCSAQLRKNMMGAHILQLHQVAAVGKTADMIKT